MPNPLNWIDPFGLNKRGVAAAADVSLVGKGDPLLKALPWIKKQDGVFDVLVHGSPDAFHVLHNGKYVQIDHRTLARLIENQDTQVSLYDFCPVVRSIANSYSPTFIEQTRCTSYGSKRYIMDFPIRKDDCR